MPTATMNSADSMSVSVPTPKKRCWTLSFKDVKRNGVGEAQLLSSFRSRYTSTRRLSFLPAASCAAYNAPHPAADSKNGDGQTTKHAEGCSLCVEVQFTGPQPIEGPASLMSELLQASLVGAHPVRLERGRKRKARDGATGVPAPQAPSSALSPGRSSTDTRSDPDAARGSVVDAAECDASPSPGSGSFVRSAGGGSDCGASASDPRPVRSLGDAAPAPAPAPAPATAATAAATVATKRTKAVPRDDRRGTSLSDTLSDGSLDKFYLSTASSTASISSAASDLEDLVEDLRDDGSASVTEDMFASALESWSLDLENPSGVPVAIDHDDVDDLSRPSSLGCSSTVKAASEQGLTRDELIRHSATTINTTTNHTDVAAIRGPLVSRADLAAGKSCLDGSGKLMLQEEIASLFDTPMADGGVAGAGVAATAVAATAATAATVAGGVGLPEEGLGDGAPREADGLLLSPEQRFLCASSWMLHHIHPGTAMADADSGGVDAVGREERRDEQPSTASAAAAAALQGRVRSPSEGRGEERCTIVIPPAPLTGTSGDRRPPTGHEISLAWHEEECDFHGHRCPSFPPATAGWVPPPLSPSPSSPSSPPALPPASHHRRQTPHLCRFEFCGLGSVVARGHDLRDLTVYAQFFIDPEARVERVAGLVGVGADAASGDQATAAVPYPTLLQIWPEVYQMAHIRAVEVDLVVEVRSSGGNVIYTGPVLKVTYRRPATVQ